MIVLRVIGDVARHFPARRSEWVLAGIMVAWGWLVLAPGNIFSQSPAWGTLSAIAPETAWGATAITVGLFRLAALVINGSFQGTWYGRWSPHVRGLASFLSCFLWMQLSWGLLNSPFPTTGLSVYPGLLLLDLMNVVAAASDAGKMDRALKDGR